MKNVAFASFGALLWVLGLLVMIKLALFPADIHSPAHALIGGVICLFFGSSFALLGFASLLESVMFDCDCGDADQPEKGCSS